MPVLTFRLKKRADSAAQLILVRDDGSHTAGAVGPADGYGPVHDLTHYAIEQTLRLSEGFLGLVASGWEIADFEVKGTANRVPDEALFAEVAAGELSRQLLTRQVTSLEDYLWAVDISLKQRPQFVRPAVGESQFQAIHETIRAEWLRWRELPANATLELTFTSDRRSDCPAPTPDERRGGKLMSSPTPAHSGHSPQRHPGKSRSR
jgi:hypothetical protein